MIRIIAKLFVFTFVLTAFLSVAPLLADPVVWISSTGGDSNPCTAALPCNLFVEAIEHVDSGGQINCLNSPGPSNNGFQFSTSLTIDCAGVSSVILPNFGSFKLVGTNQVVKIRNLTISGAAGGYPAIMVTGSGTLIIENCVFENIPGIALDIEPSGALNLVVTNSRISNNAAGVFIKPTGSVTATFNGVTIVDNAGGGLKTDATAGPINVDISNSTISNNSGNGMNAVSGPLYSNLLNLSHNVIARNGSAGIQANGVLSAAVVDTTLLDTNAAGATAAVNGGRLITYGNNRIIGPGGAGFTSSLPLQ
jgi:hypothetical protein